MKSTMLTRDESNQCWDKVDHLPGIPITLKVPTHVKVYVYDRYYLQTVERGGIKVIERLKLPYPVRDFSQEFIYTEKIFTVDFKRPAAGAFNLHLQMTDDQYIQKVEHDVTDQTITAVGKLLQQLGTKNLLGRTASLTENDPLSQLPQVNSIAAVGVFEIDAPDFEQQLSEFINTHLNQAHDAFVVPPYVDTIGRVTLNPPHQGSATPAAPNLNPPAAP